MLKNEKVKLKSVGLGEFKKVIYPEYINLFPKDELKPYRFIKKSFKKGITDIIEITENNVFIGFIITNILKNNLYVQLEYFAILPQYQGKGYGTKVIKLLKEKYINYKGIFIEIEKVGYGKSEQENIIREKRAKFYEKIGFKKMKFDLDMYKVIYSLYILPCMEQLDEEEIIIEEVFKIYTAILSKNKVKKNVRLYSNEKTS